MLLSTIVNTNFKYTSNEKINGGQYFVAGSERRPGGYYWCTDCLCERQNYGKRMTVLVIRFTDASAKNAQGISLNSCLYTGPCLLKTVAEVIARFRLFPVAVTADIEKAFLMISVHPSDRDALRFLWVTEDDNRFKIYQRF